MSVNQRISRLEKLVNIVVFDVPIDFGRAKPVKHLVPTRAEVIRSKVCEAFDVTVIQVISRKRTEKIFRARCATALLISEDDVWITQEAVAPWIGRHEHTAAGHALRRAKEMMEPGVDASFVAMVNLVRQKISIIPS